MIVIKVELWPGGDKKQAREIGRAFASNVTGFTDDSDYEIEISEGASDVTKKPAMSLADKIYCHNRNQSVWALVEKVANVAKKKFNSRNAK